jgi:SAM-dependent methyltransferase
MLEPWVREHLACPDCQRPLDATPCACGFAAFGNDYRPQKPTPRSIEVQVGTSAPGTLAQVEVTRPRNVYDGPRATRDSSELFSAAAPWLPRGARLLDLGCGPRDQAAPAAHLGAQYVGVDYSSSAADLLADAHAIPFRDATFDAVLSYAVLEHLCNPFLATREVARVLKRGGVFFGTVSQGEPFHDSFFHHTAWGVLALLEGAALRARRLWPSYDTLHALATMGRYSRVQRAVIEATHRFIAATPFLAPRRFLRWSARDKAVDELHRAASICFVAEKR